MGGRSKGGDRPGARKHAQDVPRHSCPCGKKAFESRKDARYWARREHPSERLQAYQCAQSTALLPSWHFGHVPKRKRRGG